MKVTRKSPRTGKVNEMDLDITNDQMYAYATGTLCISGGLAAILTYPKVPSNT